MAAQTGALGHRQTARRWSGFSKSIKSHRSLRFMGRGERKRLYVYTIMCKPTDESIRKSVQRCVVPRKGGRRALIHSLHRRCTPSQSRVADNLTNSFWCVRLLLRCRFVSMVASRKSTEEPMTLRRTWPADRRSNPKTSRVHFRARISSLVQPNGSKYLTHA